MKVLRIICGTPFMFIGFYVFSIGCVITLGFKNYQECSKEFNKYYLKMDKR